MKYKSYKVCITYYEKTYYFFLFEDIPLCENDQET